jgi:hypothetical protein
MSDLIAQTLADPAVAGIGLAVGIALLALWAAAAWWAYADATRRTEHSLAGFVAAGWVILSTPLLLPLSLAVYAFARPQVAAGDRRVSTLVEELRATAPDDRCATCAGEIDPSWLRCPTCAAWLASPCGGCGRWSDVALELCPWCGRESREAPFVSDPLPAPLGVAAGAPVAASKPVVASTADLDAEDTQEQSERRVRRPWRAGSPALPRSQRSDNHRLALPNAGRRLSRAR